MKLEDTLKELNSGEYPGPWLRFYKSYIGDKGAQELANALASGNCPSKLRLNLDCNKISYKGAQELAEALASGNCP